MFVHDIIKIKYVNEGYLPNYPYRMITDSEMFDAFIKDGGYFDTNYPLIDSSYSSQYEELREFIKSYVESGSDIPNWIYSYMNGTTISVNSTEEDISDLIELFNLDPNNYGMEFSKEIADQCYSVSSEWIKKLPAKYETRPATMFGELHVIKSLRLSQSDIVI